MIRSEIISAFREDNPEIPTRVISDAVLYTWLKIGNIEFCSEVRCIVDQNGTPITTAEDDTNWDLTSKITSFFDIDDYPGSGVLYNNKRLGKTTMAQLDEDEPAWRDRSAGTPTKWYRRGKYLYVDRPIDSNAYNIKVYSVLIPTSWNSDIAPYEELTHLEPYHFAMVLYLQKRAKAKVGKQEDAIKAAMEYSAYVKWVKSQLGGTKYAPIYFQPKAGMYSNQGIN